MLIRALVTAVATLGCLVPTAACAASSDATPTEPTRVMILGDSITQGALGNHTWRYFFSRQVEAVDFVGNKQGTFSIYGGDWDYTGTNAYAVNGWDSDHAAVWGGSMTNPAPEPKLKQLPIGELSATYQPDVIVSAWGINDLNGGVTAPQLVNFYRTWIADARAEQPDVDFVISELPWTWGSLVAGRVAEFNSLLDGLAAQETTDSSKVSIARMGQPYTKADDTYDGIHPNEQGERKIADMMTVAYNALVEGEPAPVETPTPAEPTAIATAQPATTVAAEVAPTVARPGPPHRFRAIDRGRWVVAKWRGSDQADTYNVRCGSTRKTTTSTSVRLKSNAAKCTVRASNDAGQSPATRARVK